jgi:hypothetical protein
MAIMTGPLFEPPLPKNCSRCGAGFMCGARVADGLCWCNDLPAIALSEGADCLCPSCLAAAVEAAAPAKNAGPRMPLVEGEDYYSAGSSIVFTAAYHLRRGYCCGNGCRHCPYEGTAKKKR